MINSIIERSNGIRCIVINNPNNSSISSSISQK